MSSSNPYFLKHTSYRTNGSGRDMYIFSNNGGLITKHLTSNFDPSSFFSKKKTNHILINFSVGFQQANRSIVTLPSIHSKTIHYGPDGTGRDTYIKYEPLVIFPDDDILKGQMKVAPCLHLQIIPRNDRISSVR